MPCEPAHQDLSAALQAAMADESPAFPQPAFDLLAARGLTGAPPLADNEIGRLLALLAAIGRGDLSVGRIYEGHVNALLLIRAHGTPAQRESYGAEAAGGALFGVWNTDVPEAPLRLEGGILHGAKNYASGVDGLTRALVTVPSPEGRRMLLVPIASLAVDRAWWRPMGMRASGSHIAHMDGIAVPESWMLGGADAYIGEPWFSGGAIRFAAVQTGGMHRILDIAAAHLDQAGRMGDPYQRQRLARMGLAVQTGYHWLAHAARAWEDASPKKASMDMVDSPSESLIAVANAARCAVERAAMEAMQEAERAVGAAGFNAPHPLERQLRDLRTYLRQPNPDGALAALGTAISSGGWHPGSQS